jgi:hypothetical protein
MEIWKTVRDFDQYEVSSFGRVRRNDKILKPHQDTNGYTSVMFSKSGITSRHRIHTLVASTFLEPIADCVIDHINSNRSDNCVENLRYITQSKNILRKVNTNPMRCIRKHGNKYQLRIGRQMINESFDTLEEAIQRRNQILTQVIV